MGHWGGEEVVGVQMAVLAPRVRSRLRVVRVAINIPLGVRRLVDCD